MQAEVELFLQLVVNGFPLLTPFFLRYLFQRFADFIQLRVFRVHQENSREARVTFTVHGFCFKQSREGQADVVQFNFHGVVP